MRRLEPIDQFLAYAAGVLALFGAMMFVSAASGLAARGEAIAGDIFAQLGLGLAGGGAAAYLVSRVQYRRFRALAVALFAVSLLATAAVFVPGIGISHGGATRWLDLGFVTAQPLELLKIGYVVLLAALLGRRRGAEGWRGVTTYGVVTGLAGAVLIAQPDRDGLLLLGVTGFAMLFAAGAEWKKMGILAAVGTVAVAALILSAGYSIDRVLTFIDPDDDPLGSDYQIRQSLIAVGSGETFGRGLGQSLQKLGRLPEPTSDSIFAVLAEESGFAGATFTVLAFVALGAACFRVARRAPDAFGGLLAAGFGTLILVQAFLNIASAVNLMPLAGLPLPFVSKGGTALVGALISVGIVASVSRAAKGEGRG
jgi:cell division protein FtsW